MQNLNKFSLWNCLKEFKQNKQQINAYLRHDTYEGMDGAGIMGMGVGLFLIVLCAAIGIFIWNIVALVKFWNRMPQGAAIASLILLLFGFPPISLIVIYASKK
jgi:hypothetical protein